MCGNFWLFPNVMILHYGKKILSGYIEIFAYKKDVFQRFWVVHDRIGWYDIFIHFHLD